MNLTQRLNKRITLALAASTLVAVPLLASTSAEASGDWVVDPDTIIKIQGDAANGFTIFYADGNVISPPTDSEARAECEEYVSRIKMVRCKTEVRVWYRDLAATKLAMKYARRTGM